eukprot:805350-Pelagomonas_calceolata.AAC.9
MPQVTQLPRDNEPFKMVLAQADEQQPNQGSQQQAKPASSNSSVAQVGSGLPLRGGGADADSVLKMINALAKELEVGLWRWVCPLAGAQHQLDTRVCSQSCLHGMATGMKKENGVSGGQRALKEYYLYHSERLKFLTH